MKRFFLLIAVVFAVFLGIVAWGMTLPDTQTVERSAVMAADPDSVFEALDDPATHARWSPYVPEDADARSDGATGEGATLAFSSPDGRVGSLEVVQSVAPELVLISTLERDDAMMVTYALLPDGDGTLVVASESRPLNGPLARVGARLRRGAVEARLDAALRGLQDFTR